MGVSMRAMRVRGANRLDEVEGEVDRHERIDDQRQHPEPGGPPNASLLSQLHGEAFLATSPDDDIEQRLSRQHEALNEPATANHAAETIGARQLDSSLTGHPR